MIIIAMLVSNYLFLHILCALYQHHKFLSVMLYVQLLLLDHAVVGGRLCLLKVARVKEQFLKVLPTFSQNYSIIALVIRLFILIQFPDNIRLCLFLSILGYGRKNSGSPLMIFSRAFYLKVAS